MCAFAYVCKAITINIELILVFTVQQQEFLCEITDFHF
jgi:hypothetical protein